MSVEVREEDFEAFFETPFHCYPKGAYFDSPMKGDLRASLDARRNPLFRDHARRTWFTAHRGGRPVGRILAHVHDSSNRLHRLSRGYFGYFDCVDDAEAAGALLGAAAEWLKARGCTEMAGSFNVTITQVIGILVDGFERPPYTYQAYSPPHIARLLEASGFEPFFPMRTFELELAHARAEQVLAAKAAPLLADPHWRFEPIRRRGFEARLREACRILNDGFAANAMLTPLTEEEFLFPCAGMMWVIDETLSWIAYHDGEPSGVLLCVPDLVPLMRATRYRLRWTTPWHLLRSRWRRRRAAVVFFSVRRALHNRGVNAALLLHCLRALVRGGYSHLGISWISDTNLASLRQMERLGAKPLHRAQLYRRPL